MTIDLAVIEGAAAAVTAVGGAYSAFRQILASSRRKKEEYRQSILKQATEEMELIKQILEAKIAKVESDLESQKQSVQKDLGHIQDLYNAEIKSLGEKIETLRSDLATQHAGLVALLTRLVDSR